MFGHGRGDRSRSRATPTQSRRIPFIAACGSGRSTSVIPAVPAAWSVTTIAFMGIVSSVICLFGALMGACRSRTNADDRLPRASLGRVEGGDGFVEGRDVADVRPQPSVPHPLDDLTQLGTIRSFKERQSMSALLLKATCRSVLYFISR